MKRFVSIVLFGGLFAAASFAQSEPAHLKPKQEPTTKDSQQTWNEIVEKNEQYLKELKVKDPAAWKKLRAQEILDAQETLARFGYGTTFTATLDEKTAEALRRYQTRSNLPITGDVDTATVRRLTQDKLAIEPRIPSGPVYMFQDSDWNDFVKVEGLWLEQGKDSDAKSPVLPAVVECFRSSGTCILATVGSEGSTYIRLEWYDVERWDEYEIVTKPDDLPCGREIIHINRPGKELLSINTAAYKDVEACTKLFGPPGGETVSRLGDVRKIMNARVDAMRAASNRIKIISAEAEERIKP
jgi:Putative peptidoglycan binding domain